MGKLPPKFPQTVDSRSLVTIPVVIHVLWNSQTENISDQQIQSQMEVLNEDFRALNAEIPSVPLVFQDEIADVEFEFCLATRDPSGNFTSGITRTFTANGVGIGGTSAIFYTTEGGHDVWDTERYLNIYVAKFAGAIGGVSSFPGDDPAEDGVQINYLQFGTMNVEPPYHLGRTLTHEVGHYFNLEHPWGPSINDCCESDFVADTPLACETYLDECPVHPAISCDGPDMFMNFMFYTNDDCMAMFSKGQKERMLATLNGVRSMLLSSDGCQPVAASEEKTEAELVIYQNPAGGKIAFEVRERVGEQWRASLTDIAGRDLWKAVIFSNSMNYVEVQALSAGIYVLILEKEGRILTKRIAK